MREIRVRMPEGVTSVSVAGQEYQVGEDGTVRVENPEHVAPLVNGHGGVEVDEDGEPADSATLLGTDALPAEVTITDGEEPRQLHAIVGEAFARTGLSRDAWNNLPQPVRDILIGLYVAEQRGDLGNVRPLRAEVEDLKADVERLEGERDAAAGERDKSALAQKGAEDERDEARRKLEAATARIATLEASTKAADEPKGDAEKAAGKAAGGRKGPGES